MNILSVTKSIKNILREIPDSQQDCAKLDDYISQLESRLVNVCVFGEFSSGKSSVINALISYPLLPVADRPLTSKIIAIKHAEKPYLICRWSSRLTRDAARIIKKALTTIESRSSSKRKDKDGNRIKWLDEMMGIEYLTSDILCIKNFLWILQTSQYNDMCIPGVKWHKWISAAVNFIKNICCPLKNRRESSGKKIKKLPIHAELIDKIEVGLQLPDSLKNACFLDAPGEGSIYTYSTITENAAQTSQIILHVFDAEHIGSKLTEEMLGNAEHRDATATYVLNKLDTLSDSSLKDVRSFLHEKYAIDPIAVSALYENYSCMLANGVCKVASVLNNPKVNLNPIISSPEWDRCNIEKNLNVLVNYLHERSNCESLGEQIASSLEARKDHLHDFCRDAACKISKFYLQKVRRLLDEMEMPPSRNQLLSKISALQMLCQLIEDYLKDEMCKFDSDCAHGISKALNNVQKEFDKVLSNSLELSFGQFECDLKATVASKLSSSITYEVKNVIEEYFVKSRLRCDAFISANKLEIAPKPPQTMDWDSVKEFLGLVQKQTCSILSPILKDTAAKPWLSSIRSGALEEYRKQKRIQCIQAWRMRIIDVFSDEEKRMTEMCKNAARGGISSLLNLRQAKMSELKELEQSLDDFGKELSKNLKYQRLCEIQKNLAEQFKNLEGDKE